MREIGGYFELEQLTGKEYYSNLIALNNGRNALLYLLKAKKIKKLYIPYFLCDSVSKLCDQYGYVYEYYHIAPDFAPIFDKALEKDEYLYIVNFYGQISNHVAKQYQKHYRNIIFDNIHAFFQPPVDGIDTIYSCRKFFGVPDGGYLSTTARISETLPMDASADRMKHILGRFEGSASDYYADFKANDQSFTQLELRYMSKLTHNLMGAIDYETVKSRRSENYAFLEKALGNTNPLKLTAPDGPYAYPFYCDNGMAVKQQLAQKKIFVATLWPNVLNYEGTMEKDYAQNILPLPCDQRYDAGDMEHLLNILLQIIG